MMRYSPRRYALAAVIALVVSAVLVAPMAHAAPITITVSGSTQMYTLGQLLAHQYTTGLTNLQIPVNPTSSQAAFDDTCAGGNSQIGMSDVYIQDGQLNELGCGDMIAIPVAISAVATVYNLPGKFFNQRTSDGFTLVHPVKLTPQVVAAIYMCKIQRWNDRAISKLNPGLSLPSARIQAFNSSEPGGSGFVFDQWLALSDQQWSTTVGVGLQPAWPPCSTGESSSGNMAQAVESTPYSIGFAGFDYAISYKLQAAALRNASGVFLTPSLNGLSVAISKALRDGMPIDFRKPFVTVKDPGNGQHAFNPACFEFFVVHQNLKNHGLGGAPGQAIKQYLQWAISDSGGQKFIEEIEFRKIGNASRVELAHGFVPVPPELRDAIRSRVNSLVI